jgi:hypothetical protein
MIEAMPRNVDYFVTGFTSKGERMYESWNIGSSVIAELGAWAIRAERENIYVTLSDLDKGTVTAFTRQELLDKSYLNYDWPGTVLLRKKGT